MASKPKGNPAAKRAVAKVHNSATRRPATSSAATSAKPAPPIQFGRPRIQTVPLSALKPAPYNPRRISDMALAGLEASLARFGVVELIIWNSTTGHVVGGHQRLKLLRSRRAKEADVVVVELSVPDEKALNVALNSPHIAGEFTDALQAQLDEIEAERKELFDSLQLGKLRAEVAAIAGSGDPDEVEPLPEKPRTKPGDLYRLGRHRLLCGDSTKPESYARLLGEERVDLLLTDPPYGVDYGAKNEFLNEMDARKGNARTRMEKRIENDAITDYRVWFASWLRLIPFAEYAALYVFMSSPELHNLRLALDDLGFRWGEYLCWIKNRHVIGRKDYNLKHELVLYGLVMQAWPQRHRFYAEKKPTSLLEYDRPQRCDLHPTMKPVGLFKQLVKDGSPPGGTVLDPFGGSGTLLIACEMAERSARVIELDPAYVDVQVKRWEEFTNQKAELLA